MNALWFYAIFFIVVWSLAFVFRNKYNVEIYGPLLMIKTKRLRCFIEKLAKPKRFWRWFMNIGIPVAFIFMGIMFYSLILSLEYLFVTPQASLIIPGVDVPGSPIYIPLWYGLVGFVVLIVVHEFSHGILSRVEGISIKSIGVLLLAILPGAFVEPDDEELNNAKPLSKLRVYAAGSIANLTTAAIACLIVLGISFFIIPSIFEVDGVEISSVVPASPASKVLHEGMLIKSVNGEAIVNSSSLTTVLSKVKIGDNVSFVTDQGSFNIVTVANPNNASRAYIGVRTVSHNIVKPDVAKTWGNDLPWAWYYAMNLFNWIYILNFLVGTFNLMPMKPLDGGLMLEELLNYKLPGKIAGPLVNSLSAFIIIILALNIIWGTGRGLLMTLL